MFGCVPKTTLKSIVPEVIERFYKKGHYFFQTGDPADHVFAIISGIASLVEDDPSGRSHPLYTLSSGDVFGFAATALGIPRPRSAMALTDAHVLLVNSATCRDFRRRFPDFAESVTLQLCRTLCLSEKVAGQSALSTVTSRLAKLFLDGGPQSSQEHFSSHRELASRVGCSRETVTRVLGRLRRAGIISVAHGHVWVLNRSKLRSLADYSDDGSVNQSFT